MKIEKKIFDLIINLNISKGLDSSDSIENSLDNDINLNSLDIALIIVSLESEFDIELPSYLIEIRNFKSVRTISEMIKQIYTDEK